MALTQEDRQEIRQLFEDCTLGIKQTLQMILAQTQKTNGRVSELESEVDAALLEKERILAYRDRKYQEYDDRLENLKEVPKLIRRLEDDSLSNKTIKKWIVGAIGITATVVGIIFTLIDYFMKAG